MKKSKPKCRKPPEAFLSKTPWRGFAAGGVAREHELPCCPDARCRRAKECIAAQQGLFCQRTHLSRSARVRLAKKQKRDFDRRFPVIDASLPIELQRMRIEAAMADRRAKDEAMTARWKAGVLDHLYGKWRAKGALMMPPEKVYRENAPK